MMNSVCDGYQTIYLVWKFSRYGTIDENSTSGMWKYGSISKKID